MTCRLRQVEGEAPSVVVTVGESPDAEGITSRSRLTADAIGAGVFETLLSDSEAAVQIQRVVDPTALRPQIALDIQRLGRVYRGGLLLKPVLLLFFDRITVQAGAGTSVFHELSIRRRRPGGPLIRDLAKQLKDEFHLFPDGLNRLQRAYRLLAVERKGPASELSPYGLTLALALFSNNSLAFKAKGSEKTIPTFRGSGEDAARALSSDLTGNDTHPLLRLGTTEPRGGRAVTELWTIPDPEGTLQIPDSQGKLQWIPWNTVLEQVGQPDLRDPALVSTLLLLSRRKLLGQLPWVDGAPSGANPDSTGAPRPEEQGEAGVAPELQRVGTLLPLLAEVESKDRPLHERLTAIDRLATELSSVFFREVTRAKGLMLSDDPEDVEIQQVQLVDLLSIRIRGIIDRLYTCFDRDVTPALEKQGIQFRTWSGLMSADRLSLLDLFAEEHLPKMQVAPEWGPSFVTDMPQAGCAMGLLAHAGADGALRFFHLVLGKDPPSFMAVPGTTTVLSIAEVVRGFFLSRFPELERTESHMFRFTTGSATIRDPEPGPLLEDSDETLAPEPEPPSTHVEIVDERGHPIRSRPAVGSVETRRFRETRQSVIVRIMANRTMPERDQAQLITALERQVGPRNTLVGWGDFYPVPGPLGLARVGQLAELLKD
jgi:hypothetical protein